LTARASQNVSINGCNCAIDPVHIRPPSLPGHYQSSRATSVILDDSANLVSRVNICTFGITHLRPITQSLTTKRLVLPVVHFTPMTAGGRGGSSSHNRTLEHVIRQACFFCCRGAFPTTPHRSRHFTPAWFAVTMGECPSSGGLASIPKRVLDLACVQIYSQISGCRDWVDIHPLS
jgi:hypothetical protein